MAGIRSKAYPSIDLGSAVKRAETIQKNLGSGVYFTRDAIAKGMGYKSLSGVANRAVAALSHYGLLDRKKDTYALSDLATHIVLPVSDEDRQEAIRSAFKEPELYRELIETYQGKTIPSALGNVLAHNHGINPNSSTQAAQAFIESARYAGVMNGDVLGITEDVVDAADELFEGMDSGSVGLQGKTSKQSPEPKLVSASTTIRKLPSGIEIGFPAELDFAVLTGEFAEEIKKLEDKAKKYLEPKIRDIEAEGFGSEDEEEKDH